MTRYPPRCAACGNELRRADMANVAYDPCPAHPAAGIVYRLQDPKYNYPAGWPLCPGCGRPALDGHRTCGDASCRGSSGVP